MKKPNEKVLFSKSTVLRVDFDYTCYEHYTFCVRELNIFRNCTDSVFVVLKVIEGNCRLVFSSHIMFKLRLVPATVTLRVRGMEVIRFPQKILLVGAAPLLIK